MYAMSEKSCPKSIPGLINMPKNAKQESPPETFYLCMGLVRHCL